MTVSFAVFTLLAGVVALVAVWRPSVAVFLPLGLHAAYLIRSCIPIGSQCLPVTGLEALVVLAIVVALARDRAGVWRAVLGLPRPVLALMLLFMAAATLSAFIAPHSRTAWGQWKAFVVEPIAYVAVLLPALGSLEGRAMASRALLMGGAVSAVFSLAVGVRTADFGRLSGIYDVPNSLALVLAPLSVFAVAVALTAAASSLRRLAVGALVVMLPALLLTQSVGGLLSFGSVTATLLFTAPRPNVSPLAARVKSAIVSSDFDEFSRVAEPTLLAGNPPMPRRKRRGGFTVLRKTVKWRLAGLVVVGAIVGLGLLIQARSGKLSHARAENSPLQARFQIWNVSRALLRDHPLLGTGLGTFEPAYQAKVRQLLTQNQERGTRSSQFLVPSSQFPLEWVVRDPHNILLSFWLHFGLLGLLSMVGIAAFALCRGRVGPGDDMSQAARAAFIAVLLFGLTDVPYLKNDLALLWWAYVVASLPPISPRTAG